MFRRLRDRQEWKFFAILPKAEYSCDTTTVELELVELDGAKRTWNLSKDVVFDLLKAKGEIAANQMLFDESRRSSLVFRGIETSGKPWAAAINGLAFGGAFELTLSCHYRVAAQNPKTRLGLPEIKVGLFPMAATSSSGRIWRRRRY